jgi:hypothetical protein
MWLTGTRNRLLAEARWSEKMCLGPYPREAGNLVQLFFKQIKYRWQFHDSRILAEYHLQQREKHRERTACPPNGRSPLDYARLSWSA